MRKRFEQAPELDFCPIAEVEIDQKSRHQLPAILVGLQHIFTTPKLSEQIFTLVESKVMTGKKATGRPGMSLWEIFVLGVVRLGLDIDYDFLRDHANSHYELRSILGVQTKGVFTGERKRYKHQTVIDNVSLIDESLLKEVNTILVKAGHDIIKKKENAEGLELSIKSDSYVVESNIHFPTDLNLSDDSARKIFDTIEKILKKDSEAIKGWRKYSVLRNKAKKLHHRTRNIHSRKGANYKERLEKSTKELLDNNRKIIAKTSVAIQHSALSDSLPVQLLGIALTNYKEYLEKFTDQIDRRILKGEKIPHSEKVFSIFEPHTEWIKKGKKGILVELGHNVLVTTDQYNFILDYQVMENERDNAQPISLVDRLEKTYKEGYKLQSISFDRGFYSKLAKENIEKRIEEVIMPKKGKPTKSEKEAEQAPEFRIKMNHHSAIESNINELEHSGVNKVPDKGINGFKRYVGYGVLAYNIKKIGKLLIQDELKKKRAKEKAEARRAKKKKKLMIAA